MANNKEKKMEKQERKKERKKENEMFLSFGCRLDRIVPDQLRGKGYINGK